VESVELAGRQSPSASVKSAGSMMAGSSFVVGAGAQVLQGSAVDDRSVGGSLFRASALSLSLAHCRALSLLLSLARSLFLCLSFSPSRTLSRARCTHALSLSLSLSLLHTHKHKHKHTKPTTEANG
jgi:hypothetical protein